MDWSLWMEAAVIPALSAIFWWLWRLQSALAEFKLDVAKNYASNQSLREVENRLVAHLNRIEAKIDWRERARSE